MIKQYQLLDYIKPPRFERKIFSMIATVHNFKGMNTMIIENIDRLIGMYLIIVVMQALTGSKLNRVDLMMSPTAFTDIKWLNIYSNHEMD